MPTRTRPSITLNPHEKDVLEGIADGKTRAELSKCTGLREGSIHSLMKSLFYKLGAINSANAVAIGFRNGILL